jgi:NTE family protein
MTTAGNAVVLAGAAALGAYEVGVLSHVTAKVLIDTGTRLDTFVGTSAGAIHAATLASHVDQASEAMKLMVTAWSELELRTVIRPSTLELLSMLLDVTGTSRPLRHVLSEHWIRGGLLDPTPIAQIIGRVPICGIGAQVAAGRLRGVALSATRIADGVSVVFFQADPAITPWRSAPNIVPVAATITHAHVLASASIPLLFPPVELAGAAYCDGGLRQIVPLSPALHLGAERVLVINPLPIVEPNHQRHTAVAATSPLYLAGKALGALFSDRIEADRERVAQMTAVLRAGERRWGSGFADELNAELALDDIAPLRPVATASVEPSQNLGALAAAYVTSAEFARSVRGPLAHLMRHIADGDPARAGDLLAFLLFDGAFANQLISLGRADAARQHDELCALFASR